MSEEQIQEANYDAEFNGEIALNDGNASSNIIEASFADTENNLNGSEVEAVSDTKTEVVEDDDSKKLFVGGLSWETTEDEMKAYFEQFGNVLTCSIKVDKMTGNSRGFGFVTMDSEESLKNVISHGVHHLKNKKIDPKPAKSTNVAIKKIFVGGLSADVTEDQIKEYFNQFGQVESVDLPFDNQKGKRKNYIFLCFTTEEAAKQAILNEKQDICGSTCDVKLAVPKDQLARNNMSGWGSYGAPAYSAPTDYYSYDQSYYSSPYDTSYYTDYSNGYGASFAAPMQPYSVAQRGSYTTGKFNNRGSAGNRGNTRGSPYVPRGNNRGGAYVPRGGRGNGTFHPYARPL